jgi:hypothetical protein
MDELLWPYQFCPFWLTCGEPIQSHGVRRRQSSISRARFVTAGAIDPKLYTYVPLGKSNSQTKFRSSLILGLATSGPIPKTQKCCDS